MTKAQKISAGIFILVVAIIGARFFAADDAAPTTSGERIPAVVVASVAELSGDVSDLSLLGKVRSRTEVTVRAQSAGIVTTVSASESSYIAAGQRIASLENDVQGAAVLQAQAGVDAAAAQLLKVQKGAPDEQRAILRTRLRNAEDSLSETRVSSVNTLRSAFSTADDAIRNKIDPMFTNPRGQTPQLNFTIAENPQLASDLEWERFLLEGVLEEWEGDIADLSSASPLMQRLDSSEIRLNRVRAFLDDMALAVNSLKPQGSLSTATIEGWKASVSMSRTAINSSLSAVTGAKELLNAKEAAVEIAQNELEGIEEGATDEDVAAARAALEQAEASLASARAQLEKTIIRAPISGTINELSIETGDFVSAFQEVAVVSNNNALEISAFVTGSDRPQLFVGQQGTAEGDIPVVVTAIDPAIDEATGKIEVVFGVVGTDAALTNGQSVTVVVSRSDTTSLEIVDILVPVSALKVRAADVVVFTVSSAGELEAHPVETGVIIGDRIVIESGITPDMRIVTDARGLNVGERVTVQ